MPKRKKGAPRLSRGPNGERKKRGKGWQSGQIAKAKIKAVSQAQQAEFEQGLTVGEHGRHPDCLGWALRFSTFMSQPLLQRAIRPKIFT
eukprot:CAMPEP_0183344886 /NCGR_PEP_ID=MMETSP0164_2-20130417/10461_1 /TAXON_ID=221442 /ORGANISM="Coccolithus pelagicus ssp braarudi, Strain PLY182g" /LENGTH=88 /DNA_ID=CAMNT_0025515959 /DNA_START=454 /DNA_END=720 /DNA_ORIENTATION=+